MSYRISLMHQAGALRSYFPGSTVTRSGEQGLAWEGWVQPTSLSPLYKLRLTYSRKTGVGVFVISPKLKLAKGKTKLPHVYSTPNQKLCLYYPVEREWDPSMFFVKTILPWATDWLYYYEHWLLTDGEWLGGGIEHDDPEQEGTNEGDHLT
ncbi:hypothetical protein [Chitinophaga deserti]|uniref:hypothetical protein n=1 Tax=Chitinophaga deserti TaxID=2164099 RepID=UPI000D6B23A8|nr:hypothetical protein [Chitinophaga deserti]